MWGGGGYRSAPLSNFALGALRRLWFVLYFSFYYFPLMDIDLDTPHAMLDDGGDDEGDDPFHELHDLGDGDEEEVEDEDIATLEHAIATVAALQSDSIDPVPDMVVPATDVVVLAADVVVPAANVGLPVADVAVPAIDVVVAMPAWC